MTYNVGDRVSVNGDTGMIFSIREWITYSHLVEFDDGTFQAFSKEELEAAE